MTQRRTLAAVTVACLLIATLLWAPPVRRAEALFGGLDISQEAELGKEFARAVEAQVPLIKDPVVLGYVRDLTSRIKSSMPPIPFDITTKVIRGKMLNAFAGPAGHVYIFSGLLLHFEHEADLAGVLAHEFAHVSQRHLAERIRQQQILGAASLVGALAGALMGSDAGAAVAQGSQAASLSAMLSYSRDHEREADQVGMNYLLESGFSPWGLVRGFEVMRTKQNLSGREIPTYMSTHPGLSERIGYLTDRIERLPEEIRERDDSDQRFERAKALIRCRYTETSLAEGYYRGDQSSFTCLEHMGLAVVRSRQNRPAQARESFRKALACDDADPLIHREVGIFHFEQGKFGQAGRHLQKAYLRAPSDLMALFYLARLLGEQKEYPKAIEYMERVKEEFPEDSEVRYHLGRIYGASGDVFQGHLQLAYAALYSGDLERAGFQRSQAAKHAQDESAEESLEKFDKTKQNISKYL
ncbi:M48 family metallopeptidase [Desulfohalovibrio reitneri]|uniref:beta-barrel assembly-enhancing protease n=1 Tax=Desulfohalovibrio reitneri TaxID=1307759 RepID=UPI00068DF1FF|nr:M48 family metallopeptidase [Desulfohalovibrio reitneri]